MIKKILLLLYGLLSISWIVAQSPGGVSGARLWLRADDAGIASYFDVPAASRTASSNFAGLGPANSTLTSASSWSAATSNTGDFLTLDLGSVQNIRGVVTRGRGDAAQWVTGYTVSYSTDNISYISLGSFSGNTDQNTEVINLFTSSVNARYVRFTVNSVFTWPSMRADVVQSVSAVSDNTAVRAWVDNSSSGNSAIQASNTFRPSFRNNTTDNINFNPTISFNGTSSFFNIPTSLIPTGGNYGFAYFGVSNYASGTGPVFAVDVGNSGNDAQNFIVNGTTNQVQWHSCDNNTPCFVDTPALTSFNVNAMEVYRASGSSTVFATNNRLPVVSNTLSAFSGNPLAIYLGYRNFAGGQFFGGRIPEVILYPSDLTDLQRLRVKSYLAIKYGVTLGNSSNVVNYLASDGSTIWAGDTAYQNNVSGIGRDDMGGSANTGLLQKQSRSVNSGTSQVVMSLGTIAASNQANNNIIPANRQFFIWGDNNGSLTTFVSTGNTIYPNRFTRIWKTQNTGSFAQNMTVYYPVSAFGNAAAGTIALLYGTSTASLSNGTAAAIAQSGTTSINGVSHYIFTVPAAQVGNMQFFSFTAVQASPGGIAGASLWLKADSGTSSTTDGAAVSQWNDVSGNSNHFSQGTATSQPLFRNNITANANFNPVLDFDGTNDFLDAVSFSVNPANNTIFSAVRPDVFSGSRTVVGFGQLNSNFGGEFRFNNAILEYRQAAGAGVQGAATSGNLSAAGIPLLFSSSMLSGTNVSNIYYNQNRVATNTISAVPTAFNQVSIGSRTITSRSFYFDGSVPEVVIYNQQLTALQRLQVDSYLALKYGITLTRDNDNNLNPGELISGSIVEGDYVASNGARIWNSDASYRNNIAGIGRDDASALHQKQSQSVNSDTSQVVMTLGTVAASNPANSNTLPVDRQFFIWGDDNGSLSNFVSTGNAAYPNRFTRIWKTQNTGTFAQNITVYYPVSAFGNASPITIALLYGTSAASLSNGTAAAITQSGTTSINGVSHYIFTVPAVQVGNMQFFSFTAVQASPGGIAGASLWLKADTGVSNTSGNVTAWQDLTNTNNFTITGVPVTNTNQLNFNNVVTFDANDFLTGNTAISFKNGYGVYDFTDGSATFTNTLLSGTTPITGVNGNDSYFFKGQRMAAGDNRADGDAVVTYVNTTSDIGFNPLIANMDIVSGQPASSTLAFLNGGRLSTQLFSGSGNMSNHNSIPYIGRSSSNASQDRFNGDLGEMIMYPVTHTSLQRLQINTYLAVKYGITLSRDNNGNATSGEVLSGSILEGDYVASDGTTRIWNSDATYQNNIAGIGRDDASALHQKQSRSQNAGSQVVVSLGTVAATNQDNAGSLANGQFFIWGDNAASITRVVRTGNGTYPFRLTRVWRTQNTNSFTQDMTVYYPVSTFGNAPSATVSLLYGSNAGSLSNGTASIIAQSGTATINGISHYIFSVPAAQVANMQFFSFTGTISGPGGVTEEALWLKADAGTSVTTDAAAVTTWSDQSGNANDVTQATAANRPLYRNSSSLNMNFNPVLSFDGSNDDLRDANGILGTASYTDAAAFVVSNVNTITASSIFSEALSTGTQFNMHAPWSNNDVYWDGGFSNRLNVAWGGTTGVPYLWTGWNNGSLTPARVLRRNGLQINSGTGITSFTGNNNIMYIGSNNSGYYNGQIGEIVLYASTLSAADRNKAESYLAIKYGLTLDQTSAQNYTSADNTVIWDASANTGYNNNIAGIGRDDASALLQKQSRSVNSGLQPVIGNANTIAVANTDNSSTFAADGNFLVWGSNANPATFTTSINYSGLNMLMERIWKVQETGTVGSVRVALRSSDLPGNIISPALIVSSDAAFNSSDNIIPMTQGVLGGVSYWYADINLDNGEFFTFGALITAPGGVTGNLQMWLKADAGITASGSNISTWTDISGNPAITTQASITPSSDITLSQGAFNFNPALNFTGVDGKRLVGNTTGSGNFSGSLTVYGVSQLTSSLSDIAGVFITNWKGLQVNNSAYVADGAAAGTVESANTPLGTLFNPQIASVQYTADNTNNSSAYYNGGLSELYTGTGVASTPVAGFEIGGRTVNDASSRTYRIFRGLIPEVINYKSSTQTPLERLRINTYLAVKYGVTLSRNNDGDATPGEVISGSILEGDYVASDGTTRIWNSDAAYQNNVAGIGRDDASALHQKVSRSVESGSILTLATGNNFVLPNTDAGRAAVANDRSFLVIGNNNGSATARLNTNLAAGFTTRITRLWKAQATNYAQAVSMQFSGLDHINFTWNLVWDADGDFTSGATSLGTLNNSGQISLAAAPATGYLSLQANAPDSDGDGVIDFDDLDDDNDGILDTVEDLQSISVQSENYSTGATSNFTSNVSNSILAAYQKRFLGILNSGSGWAGIYISPSNSSLLEFENFSTGATASLPSANTGNTILAFRENRLLGVVNSGTGWAAVYISPSNPSLLVHENFSTGALTNLIVANTANSILAKNQNRLLEVVNTGDGWAGIYISPTNPSVLESENFSYGTVSGLGSANTANSILAKNQGRFLGNTNSGGSQSFGIYLLGSYDFDNDGIPNRLDLDSDNDGCVDAIEGAAGITPFQLATASGTVTVGTGSTASNQNLGTSVNAQGVPQFAILPSGYSNTTGQALGTSQTVNTVVVGTASSNQTISANTAPAALVLTGSTGGTGFQWQVSSDNIAFTNIPAATSATYSPGTLTATRYYRVNITSPGGCVFTSNTVTISVNAFCYKPAATVGTTLDAKQGITALGRAGTNNENWPMVRKGAWTVLEAKTKGFVINRLTAAQIAAIPPANLVEGMMVYDTTANCMKVYTSTDGGTTFGWQCITTQTCPD